MSGCRYREKLPNRKARSMKKTIVTFTDDITGKPADDVETVTLAFNGKAVELDLNKRNRAQLERSLAKYLEHGRKVKAHDGRTSVVKHDRTYVHKVREWARENNHQVATRGRIPFSV